MDSENSPERECNINGDESLTDDELDSFIDFALGRPQPKGTTYMAAAFIGSFLESYGRKLGLVGRVISNFGDSLAGLGRWLQLRDLPRNRSLRSTLNEQAEQMKTMSKEASLEERLAANVIAAVFQEVASDHHVPDDQLEEHLVRKLEEVAERLRNSVYSESSDNKNDQLEKEISDHIITRVIPKP